jgi:S-formylglutathione hydrolase FrmB
MRNYFLLLIACSTLSFMAEAATVDTIAVYSPSMKKDIKCVIITPAAYKKKNRHFPVVYLLHGYSGNYAQWPELAPQLPREADEMHIIFVCPDGGYNSWYLDSPVDPAIRYETFMSNELIAYIDSHYRTIPDRQHRAITGLSMGGHGALYLAFRHKNIYGAAGATSGGVDIRPFPNKWDLKKDLGDTVCCKQNWEDNTVINVADNLHPGDLKIIVDCGVDDFFLQVNRALHQKLLAMKIDHDYTERPGAHNAAYWKNSINYQLLFFDDYFKNGK